MLNKTCPTQEENVPAMLKVKKLAGGGKYSQVSKPLPLLLRGGCPQHSTPLYDSSKSQ